MSSPPSFFPINGIFKPDFAIEIKLPGLCRQAVVHKFVVLLAKRDDIFVGICAGKWLHMMKVAMRLVAAEIATAIAVFFKGSAFFLGRDWAVFDSFCGG